MIEKQSDDDIYYDLNDNLIATFNGNGTEVTDTRAYLLNTLEDDNFEVSIQTEIDEYYGDMELRMQSFTEDYSGIGSFSYRINNLFVNTISASNMDSLGEPIGTAKRISLYTIVTTPQHANDRILYLWKGFIDGYGRIDIQLVGFYFDSYPNSYTEGDYDDSTPYQPIKP